MYIKDFFTDEYTSIYESDDIEEPIKAFLAEMDSEEDLIDSIREDEDRPRYAKPLTDIFIHETKNEMFLVLDCIRLKYHEIKNVCVKWEQNILHFVNFGREYRENIKYLQYEIYLLILCKDEKGDLDDHFRSETEKSLRICRKLFLLCNENGKIDENNWNMIPFYFSSIEKKDSEEAQRLETELEDLIPADEKILSICEKEELADEDKKIMQEWLTKDDNNKSDN